jgi:hypothetical protein
MKMEQRECSETSAYKIQTPGNYPEENIQHVAVLSHFCNNEISEGRLKQGQKGKLMYF